MLRRIVILFIFFGSTAYADEIVINGLSKHLNTDIDRNSYNYGLGYIKRSHEIGFYRNSRKPVNSFSAYYSYNKELTKWNSVALGVRGGAALYDDKGKYFYHIKPIVAGYADFRLTTKVKLRVSGTYNLVGVQLLLGI